MSFYWVNLGDSYKEVADYNFLWAPAYTTNANGTKTVNAGWKHVPEVTIGDVIFCHENGRIIYIGVAKSDAYAAERPENRTFDKWKKEGFKIDVNLEVLKRPIDTHEFKAEFIRSYNERCSPKLFTVNSQACQQYMISIPSGAGAMLLDAIGEIALNIQDKINSSKSVNSTSKPTHREAIVKARVGQGKFRDEVLDLWNGTCPVTGVELPELLIASHIVSWQLSDDVEKVDKFNGLPLSPSIDKLFDKGYVSFSNDGELIINNTISCDLVEQLGISLTTQIQGLTNSHKKYLRRHRDIYGFPE
ncbi:MAG: HNH endonuclease [Pseudomonadales bacterium]